MTPSPSSSSSSSSSSSPSTSSSPAPIEDLEWEEWDPHTSPLSFFHHCLAGSFAGVAEHTLLYPLDTVKTCWQSRVLHRAGGTVRGACPPCSFPPNSHPPVATSSHAVSSPSSPEGIWSTMKHLMHHPHHHHPTATAGSSAAGPSRNPSLSHHRGVYTLARPSVEASSSSSTWTAEELRKKRPWSHRARASSASALSFEGAASSSSSLTSSPPPPSAAGVKRLWRGVQTMFIGCIPAHALYFSSYELVKSLSILDHDQPHSNDATAASTSHSTSNSNSHTLPPAQAMLAGGLATLLHDSIMTPMDTVKQRMQLGHYDGVRHALSSIVWGHSHSRGGSGAGGAHGTAGEGWRGLYRSFPVTVAANVPYGMIVVTVNEWLRRALEGEWWWWYGAREDEAERPHDFHFLTVLVSGMGAGTVAAAATAPLDRVKTRLQTQRMGLVVATTTMTGGMEGARGGTNDKGVKAIAEERALAASRGEVKACPKMVAREVREALFSGAGTSGGVASTSSAHTHTNNNITNNHIHTHNNHHAHSHSHNHNPFHKTYYTTPREAFRSIVQEEGYRGLFRGTLPRVALHAPSVAISWTAYEMAKGWLLCWNTSMEG